MPKPKQCKIIGGVAILLGIAVIAVSGVLLSFANGHYCYGGGGGGDGGNPFYKPFEHQGNKGGVHGGNGWQGLHASYQKEVADAYDCHALAIRFKACAGVGIGAGVLQILISALYCFANKKTVKFLSLLWCGGNVLIIIALIASFSLVLSTKYQNDYEPYKVNYNNKGYQDKYYVSPKAMAFAGVLGANCVGLILLMILVITTWKRSDYDEYSVGFKNEEEQTTKTQQGVTPH